MEPSLRCHETPQSVYARNLSSHRGYPLWMPELKVQLPQEYQEHGLQIGDVGYVVPERGCFEVLFNICLPLDHDLHRNKQLPRNFRPITLGEADIATYLGEEAAGKVIKSASVTTIEVGPEGQPSDYKFTFSSSEGALLILPQGADQHALQRDRLFGRHAMQHAVEWYRFVEEDLERTISCNSLYLITGFYKTRSWALVAFGETEADSASTPAQFKITQPEGTAIVQNYNWSTTRHSENRVGPEIYNGNANQAVFISGFKIAVRNEPVARKRIMVKAEHPSSEPCREEFSDTVDSSEHDEPGSEKSNEPVNSRDDSSATQVSVQHVPQVSQPFHPADIINQYLLHKESSATVAITHDSQWATLLKSAKGELEPHDLADERLVVRALSDKYVVASENGAVFLQGEKDKDDVRVLDSESRVVEKRMSDRYQADASGIIPTDVTSSSCAQGRSSTTLAMPTSTNDTLSWTNQDPRESQLFNSWGVLYRFATVVSNNEKSTTTLWRAVRANKEDRIAKLEWGANGDLGRAVIGKNVIPMSDLVRPDPRYPGARTFKAPDGLQYRWRPSSSTPEIKLEDRAGNVVAIFRPTRPTRYQIGDVYGELHFFRNAGAGTIMHPPIMDTVTVTAMLYRFCQAFGL